jgi:hypothetical protein
MDHGRHHEYRGQPAPETGNGCLNPWPGLLAAGKRPNQCRRDSQRNDKHGQNKAASATAPIVQTKPLNGHSHKQQEQQNRQAERSNVGIGKHILKLMAAKCLVQFFCLEVCASVG